MRKQGSVRMFFEGSFWSKVESHPRHHPLIPSRPNELSSKPSDLMRVASPSIGEELVSSERQPCFCSLKSGDLLLGVHRHHTQSKHLEMGCVS